MFNYKSICYEKGDDKVEFPRDNGYY